MLCDDQETTLAPTANCRPAALLIIATWLLIAALALLAWALLTWEGLQ